MAGSDLFSGGADLYPVGDTPNWDPYAWGGKNRTIRKDPNGGMSYVPGTSGQEMDVDRYRQMGSTTRSPTYLDTAQADEARGSLSGAMTDMRRGMGDTRDAMGYARQAAAGTAPSAAEIYGGKLIDDSINSQMAMAASARGGPTAISGAQRQAAFTGAQTQQSGARDLAALRADEMARGREQYLSATDQYGRQANALGGMAGTMRGQDMTQAATQADLTDRGRQRDLDAQQFYETMAWKTNQQAQDAALQRNRDTAQNEIAARQNKLREEADDWGKVKDVVGGVGGLVGSIFSDVRAKQDIYPLDSKIGPVGEGGIVRQNPYGDTSGIIRENPYGSSSTPGPSAGMTVLRGVGDGMAAFGGRGSLAGAYMPRSMIRSDERAKNHYILSDEKAKQAAFTQGVLSAVSHGAVAGGARGADVPAAAMAGPDHGARYQAGRSVGLLAAGHPLAAAYSAFEGIGRGLGSTPSSAESPPKRREPNVPVGRDEQGRGTPLGYHELQVEGPARAAEVDRSHYPDEDPMASANRAQAGSVYTYKPEFAAEAGQAPGEANVGPMAQRMAQDPIAATAVKQDPGTGMLVLDGDKMTKLQSAGIGSLQSQVDSIKQRLAGLYNRARGR